MPSDPAVSTTFVLNGRSLRLDATDVRHRLVGVDPEPVRHHGVRVDSIWYPIKQAFEVATGIPRREFTSHTARRHLAALGFEVRGEIQPRPDAKERGKSATPTASHTGAKAADLLLVTCVKEKGAAPAAAKSLYISALFRKQRRYAEASGIPWYILSAEHGLVRPDDWLAPYERYLPDTPASFRAAWGRWVLERLELLSGRLKGRTIEVHASAVYVDPLRAPVSEKGATVVEPLAGLTLGQRLAWYSSNVDQTIHEAEALQHEHAAASEFQERLLDESQAVRPGELLARGSTGLTVPGLYSWWVDEAGAADLSDGLRHRVDAGLIYAGLAGATRWPSGRRSTNTLWSRIGGMHLGTRHEFSTFRRTLGAILANGGGLSNVDEEALTGWMHTHLRVIAIPYGDADTLGHLETDVLRALDPPLNLMGMPSSPLRAELTKLRKRISE